MLKTIIVNQHKDPERYEMLYDAVMNGAETEGGPVMQYAGYTIGSLGSCLWNLEQIA